MSGEHDAHDETYDVEIMFRDGGGMVTHRNTVETYTIGRYLAVVTSERTRTGNLRRLKYPWDRIASVADEHRPHLGTTKRAAEVNRAVE